MFLKCWERCRPEPQDSLLVIVPKTPPDLDKRLPDRKHASGFGARPKLALFAVVRLLQVIRRKTGKSAGGSEATEPLRATAAANGATETATGDDETLAASITTTDVGDSQLDSVKIVI